ERDALEATSVGAREGRETTGEDPVPDVPVHLPGALRGRPRPGGVVDPPQRDPRSGPLAMLMKIRQHLQRQDGVAAVEFAIVAMVFLVLLFGILTYGYIYSMDQSMNHAAEEGARAAISQTTEAAAITTAHDTAYSRQHSYQP